MPLYVVHLSAAEALEKITEAVKDLYVKVLFEILVGVTVLFGVMVAMVFLDWRLMLIVLLLVAPFFINLNSYKGLIAEKAKEAVA